MHFIPVMEMLSVIHNIKSFVKCYTHTKVFLHLNFWRMFKKPSFSNPNKLLSDIQNSTLKLRKLFKIKDLHDTIRYTF